MIVINNVFLALCSYTDIRCRKIGLRPCIVFAIIYILYQSANNSDLWWTMGVVPGIVLVLLALVSGQKIGYGDGIMMIVSGIGLGFTKSMDICLVAVTLAAITAVILVVSKKKKLNDNIPFAPFLLLGNIVIMCGGLV